MFGKCFTNAMDIIESQYEFLKYLIEDVSERYYNDYRVFDKFAEEEARKMADYDHDIYSSTIRCCEGKLYTQYEYAIEARKILFISIISYLEMGLYNIIEYFKIQRGKATQIKQLIDIIRKNCDTNDLNISESTKTTIGDFYRLLRNFYVHSCLEEDKDRKSLKEYVDANNMINDRNNIIDGGFLNIALINVHDLLKDIELACEKAKNKGLIKS